MMRSLRERFLSAGAAERYGLHMSRKVIWTAVALLVGAVIATLVVIMLSRLSQALSRSRAASAAA